jgi:transmembrane sensor
MSTTDDDDIREKAARFVIRMGEAPHALSSAERAELDTFSDWLRDPRNGNEFHACTTITAMMADLPKADLERWTAESEMRTPEREPSRRFNFRQWAIAASVLVVVALGAYLASSRHLFGGRSYVTQTGEMRTVTFNEGSVAYLNTRTELRWVGNAQDRLVQLTQGEALFDVVHDATHPFRVLLDNSEIRVLGTRFNVYRKPNGDTTVTVLEGAVEVRGYGNGNEKAEWVRTINANQQIEYRSIGLMREPHDTQAQNSVRWRSGFYRFENQPVETVLDELTRYTDQHIVIRDARIAELHINGALSTRDVRDSLRRLQDLAPISVKENNNTFTLDYRAEATRGKD